ncbi:MAG: XdhC family protein [Bacteroidetes bacterium]|nr:XdhC family protein [Bacteroidota bacterium]
MKIWNFIKEKLESNHKVILITVIERIGSSPGKAGYKMAVSEDGLLEGSIGGGVMEVNMVEAAKKLLLENASDIFIKRQVHSSDAKEDKSGLVCSGEQTHVFMPLAEKSLKTVLNIIECLEKGKNGVLSMTPQGMFFFESENFEYYVRSSIKSKTNWTFSEVIGIRDTLYIFGGGHVSVPVSNVFRMLGFRVIIYDNRKDLSTMVKNQFAHQKDIIDYHNASSHVKEGQNSYVAIMTVSHAEDQLILKQMVSKNLAYLGMIGSKNKVKKIFDSLIAQGITQEKLDKVDSPMGLQINSETIEEIAISIAARVIQVKNSIES